MIYQTSERPQKALFPNVRKAWEVHMKTVMEPLRNSECSKSDSFKKVEALLQILSFS